MHRFWTGLFALGVCVMCVVTASSQPPPRDKGDKKDGPPGGPPPRFQLGNVLPPHVKDDLKLTKEQEKELADLEKEVKAKLEKILTAEQKKIIADHRPPGGPGGPGGPPGGPGDRPPPPPDRPEKEKEPVKKEEATSSIQWFSTWESGLREAQRSGRPILFVSAAPHCAGVSGTW